ncbi:unnamed protein product [Miscanthus lutarioriparius]|uniref:Uncharacterized protein n=1 Tax=Miscanthus lutarioriparius TaxID=422564 RepID=A0A811MQ04_9POAL|nr:unnamed protein product [Miscanthus lutarioriparius]
MDLRCGTSMPSDVTVVNLKHMERMISDSEEIAQVATVSDYWRRGIGELIAKSMEKVGNEGVITIVDGNTLHNDLEVVEGMKLDKCYISPYFIAIQKYQKCELNDPLIKVVELAKKNRKHLLIVAEDVESEALYTWIIDKLCGRVKVGLALFMLSCSDFCTDLFNQKSKAGYNFEPQTLGTRKKVTISKDITIILAGAGDKKAIEDKADKIDGASELGEKKDGVTDAQNSTKAVEGTVPDTACVTSLTKVIFITKCCKSLAAGMNAMDLRHDRPILLTESGKLLSRSLVEGVLTLHEHNLCLKHKLDLGSLFVSSLGTFKLSNLETIPLTEKSHSDDLSNVSSMLEDMMILAHGDRVVQYLPNDYSDLISDLKNSNTTTKFIRYQMYSSTYNHTTRF